MFYDLNVPWTSIEDPELPRTLAFLSELGYDVVVLNHTVVGKLPAELTCPIPSPLPFPTPSKLQIKTRLTLPLTTPLSNARLKALSATYDLLALRPTDEKTLQSACSTLDCDLISVDLSVRLGYHFRFKPLAEAVKRGSRLEISYAQALVGDAAGRRNVIGNAAGLIRASRGGRGVVVSGGASRAVACRAPWDVINLATIWGLKQEVAFEAVSKECRSVVVQAEFKRSGWRGVVDVVYGGVEGKDGNGEAAIKGAAKKGDSTGKVAGGAKRKAEAVVSGDNSSVQADDKPISKREQKRRAHQAREAASKVQSDGQTP